ncbi:Asp-tRNA(Asn)/Glu-tRNA(Gln) amidotransferase subunit GatC [Ruminococcaceae bacterium OttesenSCG-928-A16]|nr:Asp-tRNA(Asn)/Glu-tRNA(Gln) amidotransferase subunit GatC [Ruminococcaceae bacterium OttesenSCG-928-A16]
MEIDVQHIAKLARLKIEEGQVEQMTKEMEAIFSMVENLPPIEGGGALLEPDNQMELRPDIVVPSTAREQILQNAPQVAEGCFLVPRTVE